MSEFNIEISDTAFNISVPEVKYTIELSSQGITGFNLGDLGDVTIVTPLDGDVLTYELSSGLWKNIPSTAINHNSLAGLQGGQANEYYHLTASQESTLTGAGDASSLHNHGSLYYTKTELTNGTLSLVLDNLTVNTQLTTDLIVPSGATISIGSVGGTKTITLTDDTTINKELTIAGDTHMQANADSTGDLLVSGSVFVSGDKLQVDGQIDTEDNLIALNFGETGPGVTNQYAGIDIDRGTLDPARFAYNEADHLLRVGTYYHTVPYSGIAGGPFVFNEQVKGGTSNAIGYIYNDSGTELKLKLVLGNFTNGETITGQASGATATAGVEVITDGTQALATREDSPTDQGVMVWNASTFRAETTVNYTFDGTNVFIKGVRVGEGTGTNSTVLGENTTASNNDTTALGNNASALGIDGMAIGHNATAVATAGAMTIGNDSTAGFSLSLAIGLRAETLGNNSVAIGNSGAGNLTSAGASGVAIGNEVQGATNRVAIGQQQNITGNYAISFGKTVTNSGAYSVTIGSDITNTFLRTLIIGNSGYALANNQIIIGSDDAVNAQTFTQMIIGRGSETVEATPETFIFQTTQAKAGETDQSAMPLTIRPGAGTGTKASGDITLQVAPASATGSTLNSYVDAVVIDGGTGALNINKSFIFDKTFVKTGNIEARTTWNNTTHRPKFETDIPGFDLEVNNSLSIRSVNDQGAATTRGQVVYISGGTITNPKYELAKADDPLTSKTTAGLIVSSPADGSETFILDRSNLDGLNTSAFSTFDTVYVSDTVAGGLRNTPPPWPAQIIKVGTVAFSDVSFGSIAIEIQKDIQRTDGSLPYSFSSQGIGSGTYYRAGFYDWEVSDANLTQASTTQTKGAVNVTKAAHAGIVAGGPGVVDTGVIGLRVNGISITDAGVRTPADSEILSADITTLSLDDPLETDKKWLGQVTFELYIVSGAPTAYSLDFNYGFSKYEDAANNDFTVRHFVFEGRAGATDTDFNIEIKHHKLEGWTYSAAAFVPGNGILHSDNLGKDISWNSINGVDDNLANNEDFAFKVLNIDEFIQGSGKEGIIIEITAGAANSVRYSDMRVVGLLEG